MRATRASPLGEGCVRRQSRTCGLRFRKAVVGSAAKAWFLGFGRIPESTGYRFGYRADARWHFPAMVAELTAATSLHVGEVARNPYHLRLPAWMQDYVRRGGELVGGQGGAAPDFSFATLYRLRKWQGGEFINCLEGGKSIPVGAAHLEQLP